MLAISIVLISLVVVALLVLLRSLHSIGPSEIGLVTATPWHSIARPGSRPSS
jgi:hypothetical protein